MPDVALVGQRCLTADVQFVVGADGVPEEGTARVINASLFGYGEAVRVSVSDWRYQPAKVAGLRVRQLVRQHKATAIATRIVRQNDNAEISRSEPTACH